MSKPLSYEQIVKLAVREGINAAMQTLEFERMKAKKRAKDRRLHNTKLLIRNYRMFKVHAENAVYSAADCEDSVFDILALMSDEAFRTAETTVEAIKMSAARTSIMVRHITAMVEAYRLICERSGKDENLRRYRVLWSMYISDEVKSADEIADLECIDKRTVYKDIDAATETLAALIFGVDSLHEE